MNTKTLSKIHMVGRVGKIVMIVLTVISIVVTALCAAAAVCVARLPKNSVVLKVTNQAELKVGADIFANVWNYITDSFAYSGDENPSDMLADSGDKEILPSENTEINTRMKLFNRLYSSASVRSDGNTKIVDAKSAPAEYNSSNFTAVLVFAFLFFAALSATFFVTVKLFKVLAKCETPFCSDFVSKMRIFGYSLLPVALFSSVGETLAVRFLTAGGNAGLTIQWGVLIAFAVTMFLLTVFRYGVRLQQESDETL